MTDQDRKPAQSYGALGASLTFAAVIALFALGGLWLDDRLDTRPVFVLIGILLGLTGGTIHLLRVIAPGSLPFKRRPPTDGTPPKRP